MRGCYNRCRPDRRMEGVGEGSDGVSATNYGSLIWSIAELLRGAYKRHQNGAVILPLTVIRRLDCALAPTKSAVLVALPELETLGVANTGPMIAKVAGTTFYNTSPFDFQKLLAAPADLEANLRSYLSKFSPNAREIIEKFHFSDQIIRLVETGLLYEVIKAFAAVDLDPVRVPNTAMGTIYEELIRRAYEQSNEEAGDHFTPREVIYLMVELLLGDPADDPTLSAPGAIRSLYDPACGTGGMLTVAEEYLRSRNPEAEFHLFGQEINDETYATCKADMLVKGQNPDNIKEGNTLREDKHAGEKFDYILSNPPYGVEWKNVRDEVTKEHTTLGFGGRFGAGLPTVKDGQLLFLQHMLFKMKPDAVGGSRIAIIMNGSPLFTGDAGSGESKIRKWIFENDLLEGIVALPNQLFYNTDISTYIWLLTNRKRLERRGIVQVVDATAMYRKMKRSLGKKRNEIAPDQITAIVEEYRAFAPSEVCKLFAIAEFGYWQITVERPLRRAYEVTEDAVAAVEASKPFVALTTPKKGDTSATMMQGEETQRRMLAALQSLRGVRYIDGAEFTAACSAAFRRANVNPPTVIRTAVAEACAMPDAEAAIVTDAKGKALPDSDMRDTERVPLGEEIADYVAREVLPYAPDAWVDESKTKIGYEINVTRYFYRYEPLRSLEEIDADITALEAEIAAMVAEVTA